MLSIDRFRVTEAERVRRAYSDGRVVFMGLELFVAPGALVPRTETELLARTAIEMLHDIDEPRIIDMCCGAANLACAIAHAIPSARVYAADLMSSCVELAQRNVEHLGLGTRVSVHQGDLFEAFASETLSEAMDLVVCNPPYISERKLSGERARLLELEPREAFAAGPYGLSVHMRVVKDAPANLKAGGSLLFEAGLGQATQVQTLLERDGRYEHVRTLQNGAGESRAVVARRNA